MAITFFYNKMDFEMTLRSIVSVHAIRDHGLSRVIVCPLPLESQGASLIHYTCLC